MFSAIETEAKDAGLIHIYTYGGKVCGGVLGGAPTVCVEDKACNNRTWIRAGRRRQEPGTTTRAGSDTGSNKIKHEESSAATKVNWKHGRETRSRCIISLGCSHVHGCSGEKEQRKE